jgi:hypothetical protein
MKLIIMQFPPISSHIIPIYIIVLRFCPAFWYRNMNTTYISAFYIGLITSLARISELIKNIKTDTAVRMSRTAWTPESPVRTRSWTELCALFRLVLSIYSTCEGPELIGTLCTTFYKICCFRINTELKQPRCEKSVNK